MVALSSPLFSCSSTLLHVPSPATLRPPCLHFLRNLRCTAIPNATVDKQSSQAVVRRTANFQPSVWDYNYVQSLRSEDDSVILFHFYLIIYSTYILKKIVIAAYFSYLIIFVCMSRNLSMVVP